MFCPGCGSNVADGVGFCPSCGSALGRQEVRMQGNTVVRDKAMAILGSPIFLVACICTVVSFLFTFLSWFGGGFGLNALYANPITREFVRHIPYEFYRVMEIFFVVGNLPTIMEIIGVIIILCTIQSTKNNAGFVFLKIGMIMQFVALALFLTLFAIGMMGGFIAGVSHESEEAIMAIMVVGTIVVGVFVLAFIYIRGLIATVGIAQDAISDNRCTKQPSMFVVVMNFMMVGCSVISLLAGMIGTVELIGELAGEYVFFSMLPSMLSIAGMIMFTIVMIQGRSLVSASNVNSNLNFSSQGYGNNSTSVDFSGTTPITDARLCPYCGRKLYGNEMCNCRTTSNNGSNGGGTTFL